MKNFTSCICIMGLSGMAFGDVLLDQIGDNDGSSIDASNMIANQDFEAAYDGYDIAAVDNFSGAGESVGSIELVIGGWNGYVDPSGITAYTANLYSSSAAAGADLIGDLGSQLVDAADANNNPDWTLAGYALIQLDVSMTAGSGDQLVGMMPSNAFGTNGQTGAALSTIGDMVGAGQANPNGGFGFGPWQDFAGNVAYRVMSAGASDPCDADLGYCPADINDSGLVDVDDILAIIGTFGDVGDGTYRPAGDIFPLPNGDCAVTVDDILALIGAFGNECLVEGGCCLGDGSCSVSSSTDCAANGGTYFGDFTTCADGSCVAAACCIDASTCVDLTESACNALGGTYKGDGTACATTDCAAVEAGDECNVAIAVYDGANAFDTTNMTTGGVMPDDTMCAGTYLDWGASQDGWYSYVATGGITNFTTCDGASYDTSMVLYEATCENQVACNGDSVANDGSGCQAYYSEIDYDCVAGTTYYVRMGAYLGEGAGPGTLTISGPPTGNGACCMTDGSCIDGMNAADCVAFGGSFAGDATMCSDDPCAAGAGDECDTAIEIFEGANAFSTLDMTPSYPVPDDTLCPGEFLDWGDSPDGWYAWTATGSGTASFSACDAASYDTSMALYEGSCENQVSCNGDTTGETGCQAYYSAVYDWPVTEGTVYIVRMGGWNADSGSGTITVTFTGADAIGACCMPDGSCMDSNSDDCLAFGGAWDSSGLCADANCPQPWTGCAAGSIPDCDACWNDGDDSATDCNGGNNAPTPVFQDLALGVQYCGTMAVFVDGPTGGTYRDLDWYTNAAVNAGGNFTMTFGSSGMAAFAYIYDPVAGTILLGVDVPEGGGVLTVNGDVPAGDYVVLCGVAEWNVAWTCASGLVDYVLQVD